MLMNGLGKEWGPIDNKVIVFERVAYDFSAFS